MYRKYQVLKTSLFLLCCILFPVCGGVAADNPGEEEKAGQIRVTVDVPRVKVYFDEELQGLAHPGRPLSRNRKPGKLTVRVLAPNLPEQSRVVEIMPGQTTGAEFDLLSGSPRLQELLNQGDACFRKGDFLAPKGKNAFEIFQAVLADDPDNAHAEKKIREIMAHYKKTGDAAWNRKHHEKAQQAYNNYEQVAAYSLKHFPRSSDQKSLETVRNRIRTLKNLSRPVEQLLKAGDDYFKRQHYLLPKENNAFEMYRAVLAAEPANLHARRKIYELMDRYKSLGEDSEQKNYPKAASNYENYLVLLRYMRTTLGDRSLESEFRRIEKKVEKMKADIADAQRLSAEGDAYFIARKFTTPRRKNALDLYVAALRKNPTHRLCIDRIREMMRNYQEWGDKAHDAGNFREARNQYENYIYVAEKVLEVIDKRWINSGLSRVRKQVERIEKLDTFLAQGDSFFARQQFTMPREDNALSMYRQALAIQPGNPRALKKIRSMLDIYEKWADDAWKQGDYSESRAFYQQYLFVARYFLKQEKDADIRNSLQRIETRLDNIDKRVRVEELRQARRQLSLDFGTYQSLREKENRNVNVAGQVVPVLENMMIRIETILNIYERLENRPPDIKDKIIRLRQARITLEKEIAVRSNKAF